MDQRFLDKITTQFFFEGCLTDGVNDLAMRKNRLLLIDCFQVSRYQSCHPATAMNDIRGPSEFLYCLQCALTIKNGPEPVIVIPFFILIMKNKFAPEKVFVI